MDKLNKIRRTYAEQLTIKHKLKLYIPTNDSSDSVIEMFINEMYKQLYNKLKKQDEQLLNETNEYSPLVVQRKQLQKDIDDFQILDKRQDFRAIQQIIDRVEHMSMFNRRTDTVRITSNIHTDKQPCSVVNLPIVLKSPSITCSYRTLCKELLDRLNWPTELFAPEYDRCFCKTCYSLSMPSVCQGHIENKYPIIIPRNWMKFGLRIDEVQAKVHRIWDKWAISYHGTTPTAALSMVKHRQICLPGDRLFDGTYLTIRVGHIPGENAFFTSPTIRYASQNHYATPIEFTSQTDKCNYTAKIVLRCRQMPNSFTVQCETLNNGQITGTDFCDIISDDEIEWRTDKRGTVIFDGLCVRIKRVSNQNTNYIFNQDQFQHNHILNW